MYVIQVIFRQMLIPLTYLVNRESSSSQSWSPAVWEGGLVLIKSKCWFPCSNNDNKIHWKTEENGQILLQSSSSQSWSLAFWRRGWVQVIWKQVLVPLMLDIFQTLTIRYTKQAMKTIVSTLLITILVIGILKTRLGLARSSQLSSFSRQPLTMLHCIMRIAGQ